MPQDISEAMVSGMLGDIGNPVQHSPTFMQDMQSSVPGIPTMMGMKAFRGSGTILRGGSGVGQAAGGPLREGLVQANYLNPKNITRFGSSDYFHTVGKSVDAAGKYKYNPFYLAGGVNWVGNKAAGKDYARAGAGAARQFLPRNEEESLVSRGGYSRIAAAGRVSWMSDAQFGRNAHNAYSFLIDAGVSADAAQAALKGGKHTTAAGIAMSGSGVASGAFSGFAYGAGQHLGDEMLSGFNRGAQGGARRAAQWGADIGLDIAQGGRASAGQIVSRGWDTAKTAWQAGQKAGAGKVGLQAGALVGGRIASFMMGPVGIAAGVLWTAHDLARLTTKAVGHTARIGVEAYKDFTSGLRVGIMDNHFTDTEATMTSRARGVQAIQNSRLNARSVLGTEAGSMHAHFG